MMDEAHFWSLIDSSRREAQTKKLARGQDFFDAHEQTLTAAFRKLSPEDIAAFDDRFNDCKRLAYGWDLWAVAYWMHGGCGNDGFLDFRSCLISLGRERFMAAIKNADSLAEIVGQAHIPFMQSEGFQYIAAKVYKEKTGKEMPMGPVPSQDKPVGEKFDFDDKNQMAKRFPRLLETMPEMGD